MEDEINTFKVGKGTNVKALGSAIARELERSGRVRVRAIGVQAINQANKGIANAGGFTGQRGKAINVRIGWDNVAMEEGRDVSAIQYFCFLDNL